MADTLRFYRRKLPHWLVADASYFVTMRLKNTLPRTVIEELATERKRLRQTAATDKQWQQLERSQFIRIERILDVCNASCAWLTNEEVAQAVLDSQKWLENRGWRIFASVLMSNHIHMLMRNLDGRNGELLADLGQFKNYTARLSNKLLARQGTFWAREDFDHWIRSPQHFDGAVHYILHNPVKAGLVANWREWRWYRVQDDLAKIADR
ncbi:MAG: hypothetical protein JXB04_05355 [Kiritimatiellae bacterium]|nr:hypothetical protein [Kiritimatiellia bacterium]